MNGNSSNNDTLPLPSSSYLSGFCCSSCYGCNNTRDKQQQTRYPMISMINKGSIFKCLCILALPLLIPLYMDFIWTSKLSMTSELNATEIIYISHSSDQDKEKQDTKQEQQEQQQELIEDHEHNNLHCNNLLTEDVKHDPCYDTGHQRDIHKCVCGSNSELSNKITYIIPKVKQGAVPLTQQQLRDDVIFSFIHINKAGGTTIKSDVLFEAIKRYKWNGVGFGTYRGWKNLGIPWTYSNSSSVASSSRDSNKLAKDLSDSSGNRRNLGINDEVLLTKSSAASFAQNAQVFRCGEEDRSTKPMAGDEECKLRTIWGAFSVGLCQHFPGRPCVYIVVLRDPVERAISSYVS